MDLGLVTFDGLKPGPFPLLVPGQIRVSGVRPARGISWSKVFSLSLLSLCPPLLPPIDLARRRASVHRERGISNGAASRTILRDQHSRAGKPNSPPFMFDSFSLRMQQGKGERERERERGEGKIKNKKSICTLTDLCCLCLMGLMGRWLVFRPFLSELSMEASSWSISRYGKTWTLCCAFSSIEWYEF